MKRPAAHPNGNGAAPAAQWVHTATHKVPPLAFGIPREDLDIRAVSVGAEGEAREALVRQYVEGQLLGRYAEVIRRSEAQRDTADQAIKWYDAEHARLSAERDAMEYLELESRPGVSFPQGLAGVCAVLLVLLALTLALSEWLNAAGFAARGEMQSLVMAMSFCFVFAVGALAMKLARGRLRVGIAVAGIGFLLLYAKCYVADEAGEASNAVLGELLNGQNAVQSGLPFVVKPLLLVFQVVTSTLIALPLAAAIGRLVLVPPKHRRNPDLEMLDREVERLLREMERWRMLRAEAVGNLDEFWACVTVHVKHLVGYLSRLDELRTARASYLAQCERHVTELEKELSFTGLSATHQPRN